jgi:hypothetical protein
MVEVLCGEDPKTRRKKDGEIKERNRTARPKKKNK